MVVSRLSQLPQVRDLAIVINVGTRHAATLALLSTIRHARVPTLLIDCESQDGSMEWFRRLQNHHDFHLMSASLRLHGEMLDKIFREVAAERVLMVDSDVEVMTPDLFTNLRGMLDQNRRMYAGGILHRGCWFKYHYPTDLPIREGIGYFMDRPWMPCIMLRVLPIREALTSGHSFNYLLRMNEFPAIPKLSRLLWRRFQFRFFRERRLAFLDPFREQRDGVKPAYFFYDTAGDIHEYLTHDLNLPFGQVDPDLVTSSITHFDGFTPGVMQGAEVSTMQAAILERLKSEYSVTMLYD